MTIFFFYVYIYFVFKVQKELSPGQQSFKKKVPVQRNKPAAVSKRLKRLKNLFLKFLNAKTPSFLIFLDLMGCSQKEHI